MARNARLGDEKVVEECRRDLLGNAHRAGRFTERPGTIRTPRFGEITAGQLADPLQPTWKRGNRGLLEEDARQRDVAELPPVRRGGRFGETQTVGRFVDGPCGNSRGQRGLEGGVASLEGEERALRERWIDGRSNRG